MIFVTALLLRVGYVLAQNRWGIVVGGFKSGDAGFYLQLADSLLAGRGLTDAAGPTAFVMPGYPLFVSASFYLFGRNTEIVGLIQCVLSALACVLVARGAALLFSARVGLVAGLMAAGYYELVLWTSGQILTEPLYTFLIAAALYTMLAAFNETNGLVRSLRFALTGAVFGLAALVRPNALGVALGIAGVMAGLALWQRQRGEVGRAALFAAACVAVMLPWGVRNAAVLGQFTLSSTESGCVLWLGNNPGYDRRESPDFVRFGGYTAIFPPPPETAGKSEVERNRICRAMAITHIVERPLLWVERGFHKMWNMWRPTFSISSSRHSLIAWTFYPLLLGLAIGGSILSRSSAERVWPLWVFLLLNLAIHFTVTAEIRFRVPLWMAMIPFAAEAATQLRQYIKRDTVLTSTLRSA